MNIVTVQLFVFVLLYVLENKNFHISKFPSFTYTITLSAKFPLFQMVPCKRGGGGSFKATVMPSMQITNTEIFAFITVPVFKLLSCKVSFINRKDNRNC